jgi:hypothetical protein
MFRGDAFDQKTITCLDKSYAVKTLFNLSHLCKLIAYNIIQCTSS